MITFPNAKLNIGLYITEKREDGYHNLETIFIPIKIEDGLEIIENNSHQSEIFIQGLEINGNTKNNLVWKAFESLNNKYANKMRNIDIHLLKNIPMGAGMGGGSADGVFMLTLLNDYFNLKMSDEELITHAACLGSDCPFFIKNKPALGSGRGELLELIDLDLSNYSFQIICPNIHIPTNIAFSNVHPKKASFDLSKINSLSINDWKLFINNDFETPIFNMYPILSTIKEHLYNQGAIYSAMSGSGSTIYGLFPKGKKAVINIPNLEYKTFYIE